MSDQSDEVLSIHLPRPNTAEESQSLFAIPCVGCESVIWFDFRLLDASFRKYGAKAFMLDADAPFELVGMSADGKGETVVLMCSSCAERQVLSTLEEGGTVEHEGALGQWTSDVAEA